ncbi:MAG: T9SS type A sorting domain-containing protein [Candidatus Cloacimonetes bacterium]|nr:T9SS type A sorting domain-containing protein [Candidatus Cloacimonadota bacterium]
MQQLFENQPNVIPLIWEGDGQNQSPGNGTRKSLYGVGPIPHAQFQGYISDVGGGNTYPRYLGHYNGEINTNSPVEIELSLNFDNNGDLLIEANTLLSGNISTTNNKIVFVLTRNITDDYFCTVAGYFDSAFSLTNSGEEGSFAHAFELDDSWSLSDIKAAVIIQSWSNKQILQAATTGFTGLVPLFSSNVNSGPPFLGVQFNNFSMPETGIDSFEWDFDGDGIFDSTLEDPYHIYDQPGDYTVTLRITDDGETTEIIRENYVTVTVNEPFSGNLSGSWSPEFNPYTIDADVFVAENDVLNIQPGVEIYLENDSSFMINGLINAEGSPDNPIMISSENGWKGMKFVNTDQNNSLEFCHISNATECAIQIDFSKVEIVNNAFFGNYSTTLAASIDLSSSDDVLIHNNFISNNYSANTTGGIACTSSSPTISNNIIVNNTGELDTPNTSGALIMKNSSNASILNNTIANNVGNNCMFVVNSTPTIRNSILIHGNQLLFQIAGSTEIKYSCLSEEIVGLGNIVNDPLFELVPNGAGIDYDGFSGRWFLQEGSPCIDAGDPSENYNDIEDPNSTGNALYPAMGTLLNDIGVFGGEGFENIDAFVSSENIILNPQNSLLLNIYPNPFNPETTISFETTNLHENIGIEIYNIKGQKIRKLRITNYELGNNKVVWNGTDDQNNSVSSGIYFVTLTLGNFTTSKKVLLLK